MKTTHIFKNAAAVSTLALVSAFNVYAADKGAPDVKQKTPDVSWSEFMAQAGKGQFKKADIYSDFVIGHRTDKATHADVLIKAEGPSSDMAYAELKGKVKEVDFPRAVAPKPAVVVQPPAPPVKAPPPPQKTFLQKAGAVGLGFLAWARDAFVPLIPLFIIMMVPVWVVMKRSGGINKNNKNAFKPIDPKDNKVRFADVAGSDDAKLEVEETVDFLKNPKKFQKLGAKCPKGILFVGPPGTGKTLLAKAVAGEAGVPFLSISGSDFVEVFVGTGAARVRELFGAAKKQKFGRLRRFFGMSPKASPAIIFIDEIDAIGKSRGNGIGGSNDEREQTLNQILVEMDGFGKEQNIIVLGATNRPEILDPALLRPGRFDRQVMIGLADVEGREAILKVHAKGKPLAADINLRDIARNTRGFSGADLANLVNEAAIFAGRRGKDEISAVDFRDAKDKISMGLAGKVTDDPQTKASFAYHEMGHTIALKHERDAPDFDKVTIVPRGRTGGHASFLPKEEGLQGTLGQMEAFIRVLVAGRVAERLIFGDNNITSGASHDITVANDVARHMIADLGMSKEMGMVHYPLTPGGDTAADPETQKKINDLVQKKVNEAEEYMTRVLTENIDALHILAHELMEKETLDSKEVDALVSIKRVEDPRLAGLSPGHGVKDMRQKKAIVPA